MVDSANSPLAREGMAIYDSKADATADLATLGADQVVIVSADESRGGGRSIYRKESDTLVLQVDVDSAAQVLLDQAGAYQISVAGQLLQTVSVLDFVPPEERSAILDGTSTYNAEEAFRQAAIAANKGVVTGEGPGGSVYVCDGLWRADKIPMRDTVFVGQSREGTVVRALTPGGAGDFMFDAMLDRDGVGANARGRGWCETMTIDADSTGRSCIRVYGGGVTARSLNLQNAAYGLATGLPIWSLFSNIHARLCNVGFYTFHNVVGDIGTSATFIDCWADTCHTFGFQITQLAYSTFINCVGQDCGYYNWFVEGNAGGVPAVYSLSFLTCASEGSGTPFYLKKVRDFTMLNPRVIGEPTVDYIVLDDAAGSIRDFSTIAPPASGEFHLSIINHGSGNGSILLDNCIVTYDPANDQFLSIIGGNVNGVIGRVQTFDLRLNHIDSVSRLQMHVENIDGYAGLVLEQTDGTKVMRLRRTGTPIFYTNGPIFAPASSLRPGDVSFYVDTNTNKLSFIVKDANDVIKKFEASLVPA